MAPIAPAANRRVALPDTAALVAGVRGAHFVSGDGEVEELALEAAARRAVARPPIVCHARATARRLGLAAFQAYDVLQLFAFVRPAAFCLPTPNGLARALALPPPTDAAAQALALLRASELLLAEAARGLFEQGQAVRLAMTMARAGWPWGPPLLAALGPVADGSGPGGGLDVWTRLEEYEEQAPPSPPDEHTVLPEEAEARLALLRGAAAEARPTQVEYARIAAGAFAPRRVAGMPELVLAEAGTGVGKTLGYIAPASLWAEKNRGSVWLSTYTKNLQRQVDQELEALFPEPAQKAAKVVIRKGRENYLCLLNLEDAVRGAGGGEATIAQGLMARWALATRDGDMAGGDFPAWLTGLFGPAHTLAMTDRRGECIYSACPHYRKCFIEKAVRQARRAEIVIANHALVLIQAALGGEEASLPLRYVFDEGHHVFDAADGAFSAHLSGAETAELRRWLLGSEAGRRSSRARGLEQRVGDLAAGDTAAEGTLAELLRAARALPADGWLERLARDGAAGPVEAFLSRVRAHVYARSDDEASPYSLEATTLSPSAALLGAAESLEAALAEIETPVRRLGRLLTALLDDEAAELDTPTRIRIEAACRGLNRRAELVLAAWRAMLRALMGAPDEAFVDWFGIERIEGRDVDVGMHRHWLDPTVPFAEAVLKRAHGVLITSATLRDRPPDAPEDWRAAEVRTGALHLAQPARRASLPSPFDYAGQTRIVVVTDVRRDHADQVAAAYRELFLAAKGGGLGLFTAINRLRQVHGRIAGALEAAGIPLLAQHVDPIDTGTLVDIFRAEADSCLLGTDAVRDGVDVPGRSLRLIVFDRVPWPRPDILHRARKAAFGARAYDDMVTRLRLKQAYGRLIRGAGDRGVFVMLDAMLPTRLTTAFPDGVEVRRLGLAEVVRLTAEFLDRA